MEAFTINIDDIESFEFEKNNSKVYDISVNDNNNFFLKTNTKDILVHNSGKSKSISTLLNTYTFQNNTRTLFTRYTLTSANKSIIPEFLEAMEDLEIEDYFEITKDTITNNITKSDIWFRGIKSSSGNQTANLKSINGVTCFVLDEAEELTDEKSFERIDYSIRKKGVRNIVILILNPTTIEHWIWKKFFENTHKHIKIDGVDIPISTHKEVLHIHTTYLDNYQNLSKSFLDAMEKMKIDNPIKYNHIAIGGWLEKQEGTIYNNWEIGKFDNSLAYCFGMDFGMSPDPTTCVKVAIDFKRMKIYVDEIFGGIEINNDNLIKLIDNNIGKQDLIIGDSAEKRLINEIRQKGYNIEKALKRPIKERIRLINNFKIVVTNESSNIKKELNHYVWNDKKESTPLSNGYDHYINAIEYAFERLARGETFTM